MKKINKGKERAVALLKIKRHYQITLPQSMRKKYNLTEGDYIEMEEHNNGLIIKPVKVVHPDQEYFYTKGWQKGEAEADKDIIEGNVVGPFESAEDCIKALKNAKI